jgi:hypothetical protein
MIPGWILVGIGGKACLEEAGGRGRSFAETPGS